MPEKLPVGDDKLVGQLRARAHQNDQRELAGRLKPIPFDDAAVRRSIAERIRSTMRNHRMNQAQLAAALNMTRPKISCILKSPDRSNVETLDRIARALRVDVADFF